VIAFLDASAIIYLLEGAEPFAGRVRAELGHATQRHRSLGLAVSRLSWLECRVGPARARDAAALAAYDAFFGRPDLGWIELSRTVVELATAIRVAHGLRTPDALQAASALQLGAGHLFFTGDAGFARVEGLNVCRLA
jgi:predicted nucleic acid-binding protein